MKYIIFILPFFFTGCSSQSVILKSDFVPVSYAPEKHACHYIVRNIDDIRYDKNSLGQLGLSKVSSENIIAWLTNALHQKGYHVKVDAPEDISPSIMVDVGLKLAYIRSSSTTKVTNVVLAVKRHSTDDMTYFRGSYAGINWSGSQSEIKSSFNKALEKAMVQVDNKLSQYCFSAET